MRRFVAASAALLLALAGTVLASAPAHAETREVDAGTLAWGFKQSFRSYVGRQIAAQPPIGAAPEGERITVSDGARFDPAGTPAYPGSSSSPNETLPYLFEAAGGEVRDAENLKIRTTGAVTYHFPSHHFEVTLSNLAVVVTDGEARLVGDVFQIATEAFGEFEAGEYRVDGGTIGSVADVDVTIDGDAVTVRGTGLAVHADGAAALPQGPGEDLDDFTLTATLGDVIVTPEPSPSPDPSPSPKPTPSPSPEPGELSWRVDGGASAVSLGTADVTEDGFLATATLPTVIVTDTRAEGSGWSVWAEVTDFTSDDGVLRARHLGWVPSLLGGDATVGPVVPPRLASEDLKGKGLGKPSLLGSGGSESASLGATLELLAPLDTAPGEYRAVLTITAVS
ncbi:MAG: hypothetical protein GX593_03295 [Actinomycetales bacterium]|nr:hypothetical protein [Actinomycetales bacterium]